MGVHQRQRLQSNKRNERDGQQAVQRGRERDELAQLHGTVLFGHQEVCAQRGHVQDEQVQT